MDIKINLPVLEKLEESNKPPQLPKKRLLAPAYVAPKAPRILTLCTLRAVCGGKAQIVSQNYTECSTEPYSDDLGCSYIISDRKQYNALTGELVVRPSVAELALKQLRETPIY